MTFSGVEMQSFVELDHVKSCVQLTPDGVGDEPSWNGQFWNDETLEDPERTTVPERRPLARSRNVRRIRECVADG
jgi:hypothetical protein